MKQVETYGKQNWLRSEYNNIRSYFIPNPITQALLAKRGVTLYRPKLKKAKVGVASIAIIVCLATPFTNFFIPLIVGWMLR